MAKKRRVSYKFSKKMQKKLIVLFILLLLILIGLIVRLTYIEQTSGKKYEKIVLNQQPYNSQIIPFKRGDIVDRTGTILATSVDVYNLILDCRLVNKNEKYKVAVTKELVAHFDVTEEEISNLLTEKKNSSYQRLKKKLPYEEIQSFIEKQNDTKKNPNLKGVWFEKEYKRSYPFDTLAAKVLGYTTSGDVGIGGVEDYYNEELNGIPGREYGYINEDSDLERTIKEPVNGNSLLLTLDFNIQKIVEDKIKEFHETYRNHSRQGEASLNTAVIVMDPQNGGIIAMSDGKFYNPNTPRDLTAYFSEEEIAQMEDEEKLDYLNGIWQNFCITSTFEPGSTVKPMTLAPALETKKVSEQDTFYCDHGYMVVDKRIGCTGNHGWVAMEQALMQSCNAALIQIAQKVGKEDFARYQDIFNFGQKTNIDLPGEEKGLLYNVEKMKVMDLATNSFGQNFNTTMIQVASAYASIINGGYLYQPHVVNKVLKENGEVESAVDKVILKQTVSAQTSDILREYLNKTVSEGTGKNAKVPGYSMGGKTGTAEKEKRDKINYLKSFIGHLPADNPKVLIYVVIDSPNELYQDVSQTALELTKSILGEILPYLNIFPDEQVPEIEEETAGEIPE